MKWMLGVLICIMTVGVQGQVPDSRQCSLLRELVYRIQSYQIRAIGDQLLSTSRGFQGEQWQFETQKYSIRPELAWQGAKQCFLEVGSEERDTIITRRWQYQAQFDEEKDAETAIALFDRVINQVNECEVELADDELLKLMPVQPANLPSRLPDKLAGAYLFEIPLMSVEPGSLLVMVGLEKLKNGYRPLLIIERLSEIIRH